jgi:tripartite-type tricarboxylate transporter receptor subunit TctC
MKLHRRAFLHLAAGAAAFPALPRIANAQAYPTRPVRLIVGFAPAGGADIMARLIGQWLSERLGQSFIVEDRPGAGTNIATEVVVNAAPDGYTLLVATASNAINATLYPDLKFNFLRDIAPVAGIHREPHVIEVNPSLPVATVPEFIAYAKANPGKVNMASGGVGSGNHIAGELFSMMTGVKLAHVPYRGAGPALVDLIGGQTQVMFAVISSSIEYVRAGKLRALAVTTATRSPVLPDIPTVAEFVPGYEASFWTGVGAPKNTPPAIVDKLNTEINAALLDPKMKARFAELGATALPGSAADFGKFVAEETEKFGKVVKFANAKPE